MFKILLLCVAFLLTAAICTAQLTLNDRTLTELHITNNSIGQVVRQPDGKLVALGYISSGRLYQTALIRFDSTGVLDSSFGKNGIDTFVTNQLAPAYDLVSVTTLALQGDKILLGGGAYFNSGYSQGNALLARFTASGILDSSFGNNGISLINTYSSSGISIDEISSLVADNANRIIFAGRTYDYTKYRFLVGRCKPNGQPDVTFNNSGVGVYDIGTEDDEALDIKVRSGNKLLVLGKTYTSGSKFDVALLALKGNGEADSSFGANGIKVSTISADNDIAYKMALLPGNKIICTGNSGNKLLALRFKANGNADSSFGANGRTIIDIGTAPCQANGLLVQQTGRVIISGYAAKDSVNYFFATGLLPNGPVDNSFAKNGFLYKKIYGIDDKGFAACLLAGDKFIQAGQVTQNAATRFALVQYTPGGVVDAGFGNNGVRTLSIGRSRDVAFRMAVLPWDNSFILCGTANNFWSVVKYKPGKSLQVDKTFGSNGVVAVPYTYYGDQFAEPGLAVDSTSKKIYFCGQVGSELYIFKYNANGTPDSGFGYKGMVKYPNVYIYYNGLGVLPNGNIVFSALSYTNGFFAAMLRPDGSAETKFGTGGEVHALPLNVFDLYIDKKNSTIKFGGTAVYNQAFAQAIAVYSLKFNGMVDENYGVNGLAQLIKENTSAALYKYRITGDDYGRMLVSGCIQDYNDFGYLASVSRFTAAGLPDKNFGDNGMVITPITNINQINPVNEGITAGGVSQSQGFVITGGTAMDDYFKTASPVIVSYKNNGAVDTAGNNNIWNKSVFGGTFQSVYDVMIDEVRPNGYTLYVAGTGGREDALDFGLAKFERYFTLKDTVLLNTGGGHILGLIYPNPAQGQVTVTCYGLNPGKVTVQLLSLQGKPVKSYNFNYLSKGAFMQTIQLSAGLAAGVYLVRVSDGQHIFTGKLVKQ